MAARHLSRHGHPSKHIRPPPVQPPIQRRLPFPVPFGPARSSLRAAPTAPYYNRQPGPPWCDASLSGTTTLPPEKNILIFQPSCKARSHVACLGGLPDLTWPPTPARLSTLAQTPAMNERPPGMTTHLEEPPAPAQIPDLPRLSDAHLHRHNRPLKHCRLSSTASFSTYPPV